MNSDQPQSAASSALTLTHVIEPRDLNSCRDPSQPLQEGRLITELQFPEHFTYNAADFLDRNVNLDDAAPGLAADYTLSMAEWPEPGFEVLVTAIGKAPEGKRPGTLLICTSANPFEDIATIAEEFGRGVELEMHDDAEFSISLEGRARKGRMTGLYHAVFAPESNRSPGTIHVRGSLLDTQDSGSSGYRADMRVRAPVYCHDKSKYNTYWPSPNLVVDIPQGSESQVESTAAGVVSVATALLARCMDLKGPTLTVGISPVNADLSSAQTWVGRLKRSVRSKIEALTEDDPTFRARNDFDQCDVVGIQEYRDALKGSISFEMRDAGSSLIEDNLTNAFPPAGTTEYDPDSE